MQLRKRVTIAVAATAIVAGSMAVATTAAEAAVAAPVPIVTIHVNNHRVLVGKNNTITAGRTIFHVVTGQGSHAIQLARLRKGYTIQDFGRDAGPAFSGNTKAIRRIDHNVVLRGGAPAGMKHSGAFAATLPAGKFLFLDTNTNKFTFVRVVGKIIPRKTIPSSSRLALYTYGFDANPGAISHLGWTLLENKADQPHFVVFQHVKQSTTQGQVRHFFKHPQGRPSFVLHGGTSTGALSPGQFSPFYVTLAPGKYLLACYWPDSRTGMPHAFMGMYRLIQVR